MWRFIFLGELVFPARTFHNTARWSYEPEPSRSLQLKKTEKQTQNENLPEAFTSVKYNKTGGKPCGVLSFFGELVFPARTFHNTARLSYEPEPSRSLQLKKTKKQTQNENLPEAFTSVKYNKTGGKPCGVLSFFGELVFPARTFHNTARLSYEPEPSRSLQLKENQKTNPKRKPSRSLHLSEIQ